MGQIINFDNVVVTTTDIVKGGVTYHLRDDVPARVLARGFRYLELSQMQQVAEGGQPITYAMIDERLADMEAEALTTCTAIFQHSYPEMTADDVARLLSPTEQGGVVLVFFTNRLRESLTPPDAPPSDSPTTASPPTPTSQTPATPTRRRGQPSGKTRHSAR